jgi:transposase
MSWVSFELATLFLARLVASSTFVYRFIFFVYKVQAQTHDYDRNLYKAHHLVENFFAKIKQYQAVATR